MKKKIFHWHPYDSWPPTTIYWNWNSINYLKDGTLKIRNVQKTEQQQTRQIANTTISFIVKFSIHHFICTTIYHRINILSFFAMTHNFVFLFSSRIFYLIRLQIENRGDRRLFCGKDRTRLNDDTWESCVTV